MRLVYNHGLLCFVFSFTFIEGQLLLYCIKLVEKVLYIEFKSI